MQIHIYFCPSYAYLHVTGAQGLPRESQEQSEWEIVYTSHKHFLASQPAKPFRQPGRLFASV